MRRPLLFALAAAAIAAGCTHEAPGACQGDGDCRSGEHCFGGVCMRNGQTSLGADCELTAQCAAWATCSGGRCSLRPGACEAEPHCAAWQDCGAEHACVLAAGSCDADAHCATWQACSGHACLPRPGFCDAESDCATWQDCGTDHACRPAPGRCGSGADCAEWQACSANLCVVAAGRCETHSQCAAWEYCSAGHACEAVGSVCSADVDCEVWQACSAGRCANQPGACGATEQCEAWQACDASHACVVAAGHCATSLECAAWEACGLDHVCRAETCATDAECLTGESCVRAAGATAGMCGAPSAGYDPRGVTIFAGMTREGACGYNAIASFHAPTRAAIGFTCADHPFTNKANVAADGSIVYVNAVDPGEERLAQFVPDGWEWDSTLRLSVPPSDPAANELVIPTPGCDGLGVYDAVFQAGTGAYVYRCMNDLSKSWYDSDGNLVFQNYEVLSWSAAGLKLVWRAGLWLLDPAGVSIGGELSASLPFGTGVIHARTHGSGFRLLVGSVETAVYERWYLAPDGTVTREGAFARVPSGTFFYWQRVMVLDAAGAMYGFAKNEARVLEDLVVRCELEPGTCGVVYDEGDAPVINFEVYPPRVFVFLHGSNLITGP